jgi:molecular chaperone GrpE
MDVSTDSKEVKNFLVGFEMIHKQFIDSLTSEGIEVIEAKGQPFDPNFHQAVMQEEVEDVEAGIVLNEMQKGYKLKDRVIRPAMVTVSQ